MQPAKYLVLALSDARKWVWTGSGSGQAANMPVLPLRSYPMHVWRLKRVGYRY